jgi:hypothetical protein
MTKASFFAYLFMAAAIVGLFIWNLRLSGDLRQVTGDAPVTADGSPAPRAGTPSREIESRLNSFEGRLYQFQDDLATGREEREGLRKELAGLGRVPASVAEAPTSSAPVAPGGLEEQVVAILDKREEERRQEQRERQVERMAGFFLRDVNATEDQRKRFIGAVAKFWDARGKLSSQDFATPEDRQAASEALRSEMDLELQQIFGGDQYTQVSERLNRMNRGFRGNRGGRGGR